MLAMDKAKQFFGEKVFQELYEYLHKDPEKNVERALDLVAKAPIHPQHREQILNLKKSFQNNEAVQEYIFRILKQTDKNVQRNLLTNFFINASLRGIPRQRKLGEELGCSVPFTILIDPTSRCNLQCEGCWAGAYGENSLGLEEVDDLITQAKEMGIYFIVLSGGEPMMWPHLFTLLDRHPDVAFMIYTNGTLIDEEKAEKMRELGNVTPAISLEGTRRATDSRRGEGIFDRIMTSMDYLREKGVIFGISLTATRNNVEEIFSDSFLDLMIEKGALYGWSFHYVPVGRNPDVSLMITAEQRAWLVERVRQIRVEKPIQIADFWNDGHLAGGCIAGGRRYFHITSRGDVEPCAFVHFAVDHIKGKTLKEILQSPVFKAYQKRQPFSSNLLRPCPLIDVPRALREIVEEAQASPTEGGAEAVLSGQTARHLEQIAKEWEERAEQVYRYEDRYEKTSR